MFTVDDFFKILNYLYSGEKSDLDMVTMILADSERTTSTNLFTNKLDMNVFASNDFKRFRNFLIDWNASARTMITTQKKVGDVFSLPKNHLDELLRSFGFDISLSEMTKTNESNLMLDLVNLYKIKGTPKSLAKGLSYFNLNRMDILEYWIKLDSNGRLVFYPEVTIQNNSLGVKLPGVNLDFNLVIESDPHWIITKSEIMELFNNEEISFPIMSPYIGVRPLYFIDNEIILVTSILSKKVYNEYISWSGGTALPTDEVKITIVNGYYSLLELYLVCDYLINLYTTDLGIETKDFYRYNGSYSVDTEISSIITEYESYLIRPSTRAERKTKIEEFLNLFTVDKSLTFLPDYESPSDTLESINSTLKGKIDTLITAGKKKEVLYKSMKDLSEWITYNIGSDYANFATFGLGSDSIDFLGEVMNFFKPYRARVLSLDSGFIMKNPLMDSLIVEDNDNFFLNTEETIVDFVTANSLPGASEGDSDPYIESTATASDTRQVEDLYVDEYGEVQCTYKDYYDPATIYITSTPPVGSYRITNIFLRLETHGTQILPKLVVEYSDTPEVSVYSTKIPSLPTSGYLIEKLYMSSESSYHNYERGLVIIYRPIYYISPVLETYNSYSRYFLDQGSFFDIGAVIDGETGKCYTLDSTSYVSIERPVEIHITDKVTERVNFHPYVDSTACTHCEWDMESGEVVEVRTGGGWTDFDCGALCDTQLINDFCRILVENYP